MAQIERGLLGPTAAIRAPVLEAREVVGFGQRVTTRSQHDVSAVIELLSLERQYQLVGGSSTTDLLGPLDTSPLVLEPDFPSGNLTASHPMRFSA